MWQYNKKKPGLPFVETIPQGWSKRNSLIWLHSGSREGSLHKQVGEKYGNPWRVRNAAWHLVTVTVEHETEIEEENFMNFWTLTTYCTTVNIYASKSGHLSIISRIIGRFFYIFSKFFAVCIWLFFKVGNVCITQKNLQIWQKFGENEEKTLEFLLLFLNWQKIKTQKV